MESKNNSKQIILMVIGVLVLVISVVGISFAFFTYSRNGVNNNVITTGSITFSLDSGTHPTINGADAFPMSTTEGGASDNYADFTVTGSIPSGAAAVTYYVYAIAGDKPEGNPPAQVEADVETPRTWKRFKDSEIMLKLTASGDAASAPEVGAGTIKIEDGYDTGKAAGQVYEKADDPASAAKENGFTLATGTVNPGETINHSYTLHMWINGGDDGNSGVRISDTDYTANYRASDVKKGDSPLAHSDLDSTSLPAEKEEDDRLVFSDMYYSLKIKVVASDAS